MKGVNFYFLKLYFFKIYNIVNNLRNVILVLILMYILSFCLYFWKINEFLNINLF